MTDIADTVAPKSDQMNADDLIGGPRTFTITEVRVLDNPNAEQPVHIFLAEFPSNRPFKPSKTVRKQLMAGWGKKSKEYVGRKFTLFNDGGVKWAGEAVGGIRISHMSHLTRPLTLSLNESQHKKATHVIEPLPDDAPTSPPQTSDHLTTLTNAFNESGITERADRLAKVSAVLGRNVKSPADLSEAEIQQVINALLADLEQPFPDATPEQAADEGAGDGS